MANTKSADRRNRQAEVDRQRNRANRTRMRGAVKQVREAIAAGDKESASKLLPATLSLVDTTAKKKVIHRNAAARTKSRLVKAVEGL